MKKRKRIIIVILVITLALSAIVVARGLWENTALTVNTYHIDHGDIPEGFARFRIAQISDFHDAEIGKNNEKLISMLRDTKPDIIVITGDFIDSRRTDVAHSLNFANELVKIAPCYYVTGNHEGRIAEYAILREGLIRAGVRVLENESIELERNGDKITLIGVHDDNLGCDDTVVAEAGKIDENFTILLAHRPIKFSVAVENEIDLVLSGHHHGGQFRLPFVGGVFAPNQGFFPEYDGGLYSEGKSVMIVSRGIGNSIFPFRLNNRPEIVLIELKNEK